MIGLTDDSLPLAGYFGDPTVDRFELPAGEYYVEVADPSGLVLSLGLIPIEAGDQAVLLPPALDQDTAIADSARADDLVGIASASLGLEAIKLTVLQAVSGDFTGDLFSPATGLGEEALVDLETVTDQMDALQAELDAALERFGQTALLAVPVLYVRQGLAVAEDTILDRALKLGKDIKSFTESLFGLRKSFGGSEVAKDLATKLETMTPAELQGAFDATPPSLRGDVQDADAMVRALRDGELDANARQIRRNLFDDPSNTLTQIYADELGGNPILILQRDMAKVVSDSTKFAGKQGKKVLETVFPQLKTLFKVADKGEKFFDYLQNNYQSGGGSRNAVRDDVKAKLITQIRNTPGGASLTAAELDQLADALARTAVDLDPTLQAELLRYLLTLAVSLAPPGPAAGDQVTYTLTLTNGSVQQLLPLEVRISFPDEVTLRSDTGLGTYRGDGSGQNLGSWRVGAVAASESWPHSFTVVVNDGTDGQEALLDAFAVRGGNPIGGDAAEASWVFTVGAGAGVELRVAAVTPDTADVTQGSVTITITGQGFTPEAVVQVGDRSFSGSGLQGVNPTRITLQVPLDPEDEQGLPPGQYPVAVTVGDETVTLRDALIVSGPVATVVAVTPSTVSLGADFVAIEITVRNFNPDLPALVDVEGHGFHTGLTASFGDPTRVDKNTIRVLIFLVGDANDERSGLTPGSWDITVRNDEDAATLFGSFTVKEREIVAAPRFELSGRTVGAFASRNAVVPRTVPGYRESLTVTFDYGTGTVSGMFTQSTGEVLVERSETGGEVSELFVQLDSTMITIVPAVVLPPGGVQFQAAITGVGHITARAAFSGGSARAPIQETIGLTQTGVLSMERWDPEREVLIGILIVDEVPGASELFVLGPSTIEYSMKVDFSVAQWAQLEAMLEG